MSGAAANTRCGVVHRHQHLHRFQASRMNMVTLNGSQVNECIMCVCAHLRLRWSLRWCTRRSLWTNRQ